jgi:hypothetical protein
MKKHLLLIILFISSIASVNFCYAQGLAVNTDGSTADPSAMLDVKSNNQGILIPRVASTTSITSPVVGLLIFQTTPPIGFYYYDGATWDYLQNSANVTLQGNTFNGNNQLVQLNVTGKLPALDGSLLTNLPAGAAAAGSLTGITLASNVVNASITKLSALASNGIVTTNGGTGALSVTLATGSGSVVLATSPTLVTPALGTPSALVGTNITGTAANLTAGNVTTDANLTGDVTSSGNATTIANSNIGGNHIASALQLASSGITGAGNVVLATFPTLVSPSLGTPSALVGTNISGTAANLTAGAVTTNANMTGDVTSGGNATTIANTATGGTHIVTAINNAGTTGTIAVARLGTGTPGITNYLRGDGSWQPTSGGGITFGGTLLNGNTISVATPVFYKVTDGASITLPPATVPGQTLYLVNTVISQTNVGFTVNKSGTDVAIVNVSQITPISSTPGTASANSFVFYDGVTLISDGANHWYVLLNN